jgi:zona occludens toxin
MSVHLLLGVPGSGKSYEAVTFHIIPAIEEGRKVVTNLPLNVEHFLNVYGQNIANLIKIITPTGQNPIPFKTLEDFQDDWKNEKNQACLFVIDECHRPFPLGSTDKKIDEWFAEHRHKGHDVLLITQSYGKISKAIRDIVHIVYRVRKNVALGSSNSYIRKVQDGLRGEVVNTSIRKYDKKYFSFYKSHTQSNASIDEALAKDIIPIWRNWTFIGAALLIPIGLYFLLSRPMPFSPKSAPVIQKTKLPEQTQQIQTNTNKEELQQMQSKNKEDDKVTASHPFYKLQMHIGGYLETSNITENIKSLFIYNVLLSQNGQVIASITDKDLIKAGYTVESFGACAMKIKYNNFYDYITCDSPRISSPPQDNFNKNQQQPQQLQSKT